MDISNGEDGASHLRSKNAPRHPVRSTDGTEYGVWSDMTWRLLAAARPASGAGISKALQSGLAAGECAVAALTNGGPDDFTNYEQRIRSTWGREYRHGRLFHRLAGVPAVASAGVHLLDGFSHAKSFAQQTSRRAPGRRAEHRRH
ncbi:hypothetical protein MycrhDRAFT_1169 [Mycolicibacterium rhodesiae JS60]|nr:hypothetical protein MycrhDRAFT_1169 [Mycolicibacterium rhodesiae JS60]